MTLVLTLVTGGSGARRLADAAPGGVGAARERGGVRWSVTEREIDVKRHPNVEPDLLAFLEAEAAAAQTDWAITPVASRRKKLLISDMDSTIIGQECIDELADFAGLKPQVSAITERAMRGELDFVSALTERVAMLKGLELSALDACYAQRVTLNPGARELVATMKAHGARTVLVSGGFRFFTSRVAKAAGFDTDRANTLLHDGKTLAGAVAQPVLGREAKLAALLEESAAFGLTPQDAVAIGDGANDLDMIRAAGLGIAYKAKPIVAVETKARIAHTDLTAALFFQGYRAEDIVSEAVGSRQ
jgi:phosphoserine phosphatase